MKFGCGRATLGTAETLAVCLLAIVLTSAQSMSAQKPQAAPVQKPQMAEDVFKDVRVLKGIPVDEFMDTMGFMAASLTLNCTECHGDASSTNWTKYADDTPLKTTARKMMLMVIAINKANFGGVRDVTCFTCHRGDQRPKVDPNLASQYGEPPPDDPNEVQLSAQAPEGLSADQTLDKYIQALGGAQQLAGLTSFVAQGTYEGFDTLHQKVPVEIYAKAPEQRTTVIHPVKGELSTRTYDGRAGWIAASDKPVPLMALTGGELDGARIDAILSFPARIKQAFSQWRVGTTRIDDRDVIVVQGNSAGRPPVKFFFDKESGLLVRQVRYSTSVIGIVPTQIDYSDYRDVAGVKMPFQWITTWTDGQSTTILSEVQPNAAIDAAKLAKPAPAPPQQ